MLNKLNINVSIIIVNYNLADEIYKCVQSIKKSITTINYEVIIVDNKSEEKDINKLISYFQDEPDITTILNNKNLGFGSACNIGVKNINGKYLLFLNPDTTIEYNILDKLIKLLEKNIKYGIIGVKQSKKDLFLEYSAGYFPNIVFEFFNIFFIGRLIEAFIMGIKNKFYSETYSVDWVIGSFMFMKREIFEKVNGFDQKYFLFFEEVDLCKRIKKEGYEIIFNPKEFINHSGSQVAKKDYSLFTQYFYESKRIFMLKYSNIITRTIYSVVFVLQIMSQFVLWSLLYPFTSSKPKGKLKGFKNILLGMIK